MGFVIPLVQMHSRIILLFFTLTHQQHQGLSCGGSTDLLSASLPSSGRLRASEILQGVACRRRPRTLTSIVDRSCRSHQGSNFMGRASILPNFPFPGCRTHAKCMSRGEEPFALRCLGPIWSQLFFFFRTCHISFPGICHVLFCAADSSQDRTCIHGPVDSN